MLNYVKTLTILLAPPNVANEYMDELAVILGHPYIKPMEFDTVYFPYTSFNGTQFGDMKPSDTVIGYVVEKEPSNSPMYNQAGTITLKNILKLQNIFIKTDSSETEEITLIQIQLNQYNEVVSYRLVNNPALGYVEDNITEDEMPVHICLKFIPDDNRSTIGYIGFQYIESLLQDPSFNIDLSKEHNFYMNKNVEPTPVELSVEDINANITKAIAEENAKITDPVKKSFLDHLKKFIGF